MKEEEDLKLQYFATYYDRKQSATIDSLKNELEKSQNAQINYECFFSHPDIKILYGLLFFAMTPPQQYEGTAKRKACLKKMLYDQLSQQQKDKLKTLYIDWRGKTSLASAFCKKQNKFITNKGLIKKLTDKINITECYDLVRLSFASTNPPIHASSKIDGLIYSHKVHQDWITILPFDGRYLLAIHSAKQQLKKDSHIQQQNIRKSQIRNSSQSNDSQEANEQTDTQSKRKQNKITQKQKITKSQIRNSSQSNDSQEANEQADRQKQKKGKQKKLTQKSKSTTQSEIVTGIQAPKLSKANSTGAIPQSNRFDPYEVTWFEVFVVLIIIFALLSEFFHIFDPFLHTFNKDVGNYHFLQGAYKLNNLIFGSSHNESL